MLNHRWSIETTTMPVDQIAAKGMQAQAPTNIQKVTNDTNHSNHDNLKKYESQQIITIHNFIMSIIHLTLQHQVHHAAQDVSQSLLVMQAQVMP